MFLKDENAIGARTLNRAAIDQNLSRSLGVQSSHEVQQGGLAAAGWADDAQKFSGRDLEIDVVEREQAFAALRAIAERDVMQADLGNSKARRSVWDGPGLRRCHHGHCGSGQVGST